MMRIFSSANLAGVLILAIVCAVQWKSDSDLSHEVDRLQQLSADQSAKIDDQDKSLKQDAADLDDLRQRLAASQDALKDTQDKLTAATAERDQLKAAVDKWTAAVASRDDAIKQANAQIQKLSADRDDAVKKFNDLADKYNDVVKQLNARNH
jgi:chromosome segregation ATPase